MIKQRGGKRDGAGRPEGSKNARTLAVMEYLDPEGNNPVIKLVKIMNKAYGLKDFRLSADCAKALLPFYVSRQRNLDNEIGEIYTPIQVSMNIPIPGSGWRNKPDHSDAAYGQHTDPDFEHSIE